MEKQINNFLEFLQKDKKLTDNTLQSYKRDGKKRKIRNKYFFTL